MELNQENRMFGTSITVLDTVAEQLADVDLTLPDYCPDIEKIIKCTLTPKIQSKTLSAGQLQIDGSCVVNVMYVDSSKKTIRCCEQSVNFSQSFSVKDVPDNPVIITKTKSEYINCRALSPRRVVMHGAFSLYAKVKASTKTSIYYSDDPKLESLRKNVSCSDLKSLCQEQFNVCEEVSVADKPAIESIIRSSVDVSITDVKAVTGKLMINGEINLKLLYISDVETGNIEKIDYLIPFNQIIDCEGVDEKTINNVECEVLSYDIRLKNDMLSEKPSIIVDIMLCITEEGFLLRDEEITVDSYSVYCASKPQFQQLAISNEVTPVNESQMEKLAVKIDDGKITKILDIYADDITCEQSNSDDGLKAGGKINLCIIAYNEENFPVIIERTFDYEHRFNLSQDYNSFRNIYPHLSSISYRLADDNTIEIRCEIKLCACAEKTEKVKAVSSMELFEDKLTAGDDCALTLYYAKQGESLWDIAKAHNTRLNLLLSENSSENITLDSSQMLLIPKI